jgi:hypothetical protein
MLVWSSVAAVAVIAFLCWRFYLQHRAGRIEVLNEKRRSTSRMVSRAELVDGSRHMEVSLALTGSTLFYENADLEASLDLDWVREIEYDTRLATGHAVEGGKVLRLRCYSQSFEFVLRDDVAPRWHMMLPPRREAPPLVTPELTTVAAT